MFLADGREDGEEFLEECPATPDGYHFEVLEREGFSGLYLGAGMRGVPFENWVSCLDRRDSEQASRANSLRGDLHNLHLS